MVSNTPEGPDFVCVGMPKAATGWLFDQLQYHPDFWMTPVKGLHYLDRGVPSLRNVLKRLQRLESHPGDLRGDRRAGDQRDLEFLKEAASLSGRPRDLGAYGNLFRFKNGLLSGEITALYYGIEEEVMADLAQKFPRVKIILLVRDPVARAWSNISMAYREGRFDVHLLDDLEAFRAHLASAKTVKDKSASEVAKRWMRAAPRLRFRHFFFDDIASDSAKAREEILVYLGADPAISMPQKPASYNRKGGEAKLELGEQIKTVLVENLAEELRACAEVFGGHARGWAARYGV